MTHPGNPFTPKEFGMTPTTSSAAATRTTRSMRRALVEPRAGVRLEDADVPVPAPGQVLVRSTLVGICGSDTHALAGQHPFLNSAYSPGHEAVGIVSALGEGVNALAIGQRVILKPNVSCGACQNCSAGRTNACEQLSWVGCDPSRHWSGAMAEFFVAPASNLYPVPDTVDDQTAALVECLATPVHAAVLAGRAGEAAIEHKRTGRRQSGDGGAGLSSAVLAGDLTGSRVVVLGAGTIGVLCVVAALHAGAQHVVVTDLDEGKLARALRIGAHGAVSASHPDVNERVTAAMGGPADVVLDCVASERSFAQSVALLRRAGTLAVVGVPARDAVLPMPLIQDWEIRIQGCAAYTEADVVTAIDIAAAGGIPTGEIVSATYDLEQIADAFAAATSDSSGKLLVSPHS
jgi:threonine dehydrogenase-like Zn-dependent dehydrogenase